MYIYILIYIYWNALLLVYLLPLQSYRGGLRNYYDFAGTVIRYLQDHAQLHGSYSLSQAFRWELGPDKLPCLCQGQVWKHASTNAHPGLFKPAAVQLPRQIPKQRKPSED